MSKPNPLIGRLATIAAMMGLTGNVKGLLRPRRRYLGHYKYPFNVVEKTKLAGLQGKAKKVYVKELKLKYQGPQNLPSNLIEGA